LSDVVSNPIFNFWFQIALFLLSLVGGVLLQRVVTPRTGRALIESRQVSVTLTTVINRQQPPRKQTKKRRRKSPLDDLFESIEKEPVGTAIGAIFVLILVAAAYLNFHLYILVLVAAATVVGLVLTMSALIYLRSTGLTVGPDTNRFLAVAATLSFTGYVTILFLRTPIYFPAGNFEDLLRSVEAVGGFDALDPYGLDVHFFLLLQLLGALVFVLMVVQLLSVLVNLWASINLQLGSKLTPLWTWLYQATERYGLVLDKKDLRWRLISLSFLALTGLLLSSGLVFGLLDALV
jgi:hypothetical protein